MAGRNMGPNRGQDVRETADKPTRSPKQVTRPTKEEADRMGAPNTSTMAAQNVSRKVTPKSEPQQVRGPSIQEKGGQNTQPPPSKVPVSTNEPTPPGSPKQRRVPSNSDGREPQVKNADYGTSQDERKNETALQTNSKLIRGPKKADTDTELGGRKADKLEVQAPTKPLLKKEIEASQPVESGQKLKQRTKSVTFITEPSDLGSASNTAKPKSAMKILFLDFSVMLVLWSMRFFIPWIDSWHNFNFHLLREPSFWDPLERSLQTHQLIVFAAMSLTTISVSLFADFVNLKFVIYLFLLMLFIACPALGAFLNSALVARNYYQDFYKKWAFTSDILFHWAESVAFVSFPIQLSCIFSQYNDMPRQAHYNWTALFILLETVNRYINFWVIPGKCPTRTFTQTAIWVLMAFIILIVFQLALNYTLHWAKPEIIYTNKYLKNSRKDQQPGIRVELVVKKFLWFSCILIPILITSCVFATLERLRPDDDWDAHYFQSATSMFLLGEMLGPMIMVPTLFIVRWKSHKLQRIPFLRPDILALGLPHVINVIALVILMARFVTLSHLKEGDVIIGPVHDSKKTVVEFFNFDFRNRTVCVHSSSFRPLKIGPRERATRELQDLTVSRVHFTVTLDPKTTPPLTAADSFSYKNGDWVTFIITLPFSNIKYTDIQAIYNKPEIIRVEGTENLHPQEKPQVCVMNTFAYLSKSNWTFSIQHQTTNFNHNFPLMLKWKTVIVEVPPGDLTITYQLNYSRNPQAISIALKAEKYCVYCILLGHARPMAKKERSVPRMLKDFKLMEIAGPGSRHIPSKAQLQKDVAIMLGMTVAGIAFSGIFVGLIYLFWLDTPFTTFQTTCFAVFWVLLTIPENLSKIKAVDIGLTVIAVLLGLQLMGTVLHFGAATFLYQQIFDFRKRPD